MVEFTDAFPHLFGFISSSKQNLWDETEIGTFIDGKNFHTCSPDCGEHGGRSLLVGFALCCLFIPKRNYKGAEEPCAQR